MPVRSGSPDVVIPDVPFFEYVLRHAARLGDKPAMVDGPSGRTLTYAQLAGGAKRVAAGLAARGFGKGDVFGIYSPNLPEYALAFLGVTMAGGINTTANPLYTAEELAKQLQDCKAKFLVTVPPFLDKALAAAKAAGVKEVFVFGEAPGATPFAELMKAGDTPPAVKIDPNKDLAVLPYSSGTTGLPKGVILTHHNLVANLCQCEGMQNWQCLDENDQVIAVLPYFHIYGMVVIQALGLARGATIISMPKFDMIEFLEIVQKYKITVLPLVPPIVLGLVKHPAVANYDLKSVRLIFCGAAPLGEEIARAAAEKLKCPVVQGYGMTEASPVTHLGPTHNEPWKPGSAGRVVPNTEVKVVAIAGDQEVAQGKDGELWIRGPQIMQGYLGKPEETAACLDREGWYHTGDVGYVDEEGFFFIVDRTKELIKYKGLQVAPAELEALLLTHPAVLDVAVVRKKDEEAGEIPKAFVVLKPDEAAKATTGASIMEWVSGKVAPHKKVRDLEFIDAIPKSASGKILRRLLLDRA